LDLTPGRGPQVSPAIDIGIRPMAARWRCGVAGADDARGRPVPGGHFFPEEHPAGTVAALRAFLTT